MAVARIALIGIGVVLWLPLALIVGCKGGACGHAWDSPPDSIRHQLYDLLVEHRVLVGITFSAYGVAAIAVLRRDFAAAFTSKALLRIAGLIAIAIALVGAAALLAYL